MQWQQETGLLWGEDGDHAPASSGKVVGRGEDKGTGAHTG